MPARIVLASVATLTLSLVAAVSTAQTPSEVRAASAGSPDQVILVGCVVRDGDGPFFLRALPSDIHTRRRSAGSNSAKGSTPIGSSGDVVALNTSAGSNSAKSSTPIPVSVGTSGRRTGAVMSAKGSVPIATSVVAYELDLTAERFSQSTDHVFEISGRLAAISASPSSSPSFVTRRVEVESVRVLTSICAQ